MTVSHIDAQPALRLSGPASLVEGLPYLLGFRPRNSLIVVALGSRPDAAPRVVALARVDLIPEAAASLAAMVTRAQEKGADHCLVVAVGEPVSAAEVPDLTWAQDHPQELALALAVADALDDCGVPAKDLLIVSEVVGEADASGWRWRSAWCQQLDCCPPEGSFVADAGVVSVRAIGHGLTAAPDRESLREELVPDRERVAEVAKAIVGLPPLLLIDRRRRQALIDEFQELMNTGIEPVKLPAEALARLLVGLTHLHLRDGALLLRRHRRPKQSREAALRAAQRFWAGVVRCAPDTHVAPPASVLAMLSYWLGDGARANIALDRALAADPDYALAVLLVDALSAALPPAELERVFTQFAELRPSRTGRVRPIA